MNRAIMENNIDLKRFIKDHFNVRYQVEKFNNICAGKVSAEEYLRELEGIFLNHLGKSLGNIHELKKDDVFHNIYPYGHELLISYRPYMTNYSGGNGIVVKHDPKITDKYFEEYDARMDEALKNKCALLEKNDYKEKKDNRRLTVIFWVSIAGLVIMIIDLLIGFFKGNIDFMNYFVL
ncbi:MAG: hypothetical protein ABSF18_03685 [Gammaproteobacteria bacterium]|jgi:hypothetical protein